MIKAENQGKRGTAFGVEAQRAPTPRMYSLSIDKTGNKLVITFKDDFDLGQAEQLYAQLQDNIATLKKGFSMFVDLTSLGHMELSARPCIEKTMDLFNKHGVAKVVRIIPDPKKDIGFNIMSLFHYSDGVSIQTYASYQEAVENLDIKKLWSKKESKGDFKKETS